ncbi:SgcJ/EcaC family oxidoreductase [Saccharopolyspora sp. NPDC050389]|uniref:SgcJ/EcaC family oxidoreductase n=1 Tax=Saccharopolyspora sp. NPDC050389 TaxID=3155516 RepID=UPI003401FFDE
MTDNVTQPPLVEDITTDHEPDIVAIKQVIADVETAFNTNDPDLMTAHFARNASVVNAVGMLMSGREALLDANRKGLAGFLRDEHVRYEVSDIVFIRPDVAIAHKNARATKPDGELIDVDPAMIALYVLVKEQNRWWIAARQNTLTQS